jgi:hypothetical protein
MSQEKLLPIRFFRPNKRGMDSWASHTGAGAALPEEFGFSFPAGLPGSTF